MRPLLSEKVLQKIRNKGIKSAHNEKHTWSEKEKEEFIRYSKDWFDLYKELRSNNI